MADSTVLTKNVTWETLLTHFTMRCPRRRAQGLNAYCRQPSCPISFTKRQPPRSSERSSFPVRVIFHRYCISPRPAGNTAIPPSASCVSKSDRGVSGAAAAMIILSKGPSSAQPSVPSPTRNSTLVTPNTFRRRWASSISSAINSMVKTCSES